MFVGIKWYLLKTKLRTGVIICSAFCVPRMGPGLWRFSSVAADATAQLRIAARRLRKGLCPLTPFKLLSKGESGVIRFSTEVAVEMAACTGWS